MMMCTVQVLAIVVFLVGSGESQQCNELTCPGNECLARRSVCNGTIECLDGRGSLRYLDERDCSGSNYTCENGHEIFVDSLCDGMDDCGDNSDETSMLCIGATTTPSSNPNSNNEEDDEYDLVIPRLVLFILIPIIIVMVIVIVVPIICLCFLRRYKLRNMKYRVRIAESAKLRKDTLEQSRLTQGTYRNAYAETSFNATGQSLPPAPQPQSSPPPVPQWRPPVPPSQSPVPQWRPPAPNTQPPVPQWQPPVPNSQSPVPQWRPPAPYSQSPQWQPPAPRSQSPVPRSPAPLPPISRQNKPKDKPPAPTPPDDLTPLQSTTDVTIEAQVPPSFGNRTSTVSGIGAYDLLAAVTGADPTKRRTTVSGVKESKLRHSTSSRSAFHSLGRIEQPTTPPSSPPPPPPLKGILPPPVAPKPKKQANQQQANEVPDDTYEDTISNLEPLYEPIPGDQPEEGPTGYVDVIPPPFVDSSENIYDDDAGIHAMEEPKSNTSYDTYDVPPTSQPVGSHDTYDVPPTSQPGSYDTYDVPTSQPPPSSDNYDPPTSQPSSYDTYDVPVSQPEVYNASDALTSQPNSYDTYDVPISSTFSPPPRPPKPPENPLDRLVEEKDPINKYDQDADQEVCKLNEVGTTYATEVLDLNDND